jgi:hypothetical protein
MGASAPPIGEAGQRYGLGESDRSFFTHNSIKKAAVFWVTGNGAAARWVAQGHRNVVAGDRVIPWFHRVGRRGHPGPGMGETLYKIE